MIRFGEIINQAFGLFRYVTDGKILKYFKRQYVYSCLSEATYTCVAEKDGQIVGVIMGNAKKDYNVLKHIFYIIKTAVYSSKMVWYLRKNKKMIEDFKKLHRIYQKILQKHKSEFDGVLTLFAVNENYRGYGIGKALLEKLFNYLQEQQVKKIYLYTDTTCNYGFYEHQGFKRLEEQALELIKEKEKFQMNVFLYGYYF